MGSWVSQRAAWIFVIGLFMAFVMGFATGANDVANTFGTSVGSGALTLRKALVVAAIFEFLGALSLGSRVAGTVSKGIADPACFEGEGGLLMVGMLSALASAGVWLIVASVFGLPVSTTHSIVGAIIGMGIALKGPSCIKWGFDGMLSIALSWVTSPIFAGVIAFGLYWLVLRLIIHAHDPVRNAFIGLPILFALTTGILLLLIGSNLISQYVGTLYMFLIVLGCSVLVAIFCLFVVNPLLRKWIDGYLPATLQFLSSNTNPEATGGDLVLETIPSESSSNGRSNGGDDTDPTVNAVSRARESMEKPPARLNGNESDDDSEEAAVETTRLSTSEDNETDVPLTDDNEDGLLDERARLRAKAKKLFLQVQLFSASLGAFAHGANDTANAIGPFAAIFFLWSGQDTIVMDVPIWIIALGGVSIVVGLAVLGSRVIQTMGTDLTHVDFVNGFTTELSSGMTVVLASYLKVPVSSTHCQVGAIVGVGVVPDSEKVEAGVHGVNWKMFGKIAASWLITVPVSGVVAGLLAWVLAKFITV